MENTTVSSLDLRPILTPVEIMEKIQYVSCPAVRASIWAGAYQVVHRRAVEQAAKIRELSSKLANVNEAIRADCCN